MPKGTSFASDMLRLVFHGVPIPGIADNAAIGALTVLEVALHTADPGSHGDQTTHEANFEGYERSPAVRTAEAWPLVNDQVSNAAIVWWPPCTDGDSPVTFFSVGAAHTGAGKIFYRGPIALLWRSPRGSRRTRRSVRW